MRRVAWALGLVLIAAGCGSSRPAKQHRAGSGIPGTLLAEVRPIGRGPRFEPRVSGRVPGPCTTPLGARLQAHIEIFGADRVVLLPAGIGTRPPRLMSDSRLVHARCFGDLVTLDPTGVVLVRPHQHLTVGSLFRAWGQRLGARRIASFTGGPVRVYVDGKRHPGPARAVPLAAGAEIVLEVGPRVPPHSRFSFPPASPASLR